MFNMVFLIINWIAWAILADKKRWRELFLVSLFAVSLGLLTDVIMVYYPLWTYICQNQLLGFLLNDFGCYVVIPYLFIQWLPRKQSFQPMFVYFFIWTCISISIELLFLKTNHMTYDKWWNLTLSYLADWFLYWLFYIFHKGFCLRELSKI